MHYIDGIPRLAESWQMSHDLQQARPAAPEYTIDEAYFRDRFDVAPSMMTYIHHQRESPFWDRSSLVGQYERIRIPTFVIGGWYDGYRDTVPRMLENLEAPVKGIIGPWSHYYPHNLPVAADRVAPRGGAMVRPLAARARHRNHGRARLRGIRAQLAPARSGARRGAGYLAVGRGLADRAYPRLDPACTAEPYLGGVGPGRRGAPDA